MSVAVPHMQGGAPQPHGNASAQQGAATSTQPAPSATAANSSAVVPGQEGGQLTTAMLAAATPEQQKQMLGERLFPLVHGLQVWPGSACINISLAGIAAMGP